MTTEERNKIVVDHLSYVRTIARTVSENYGISYMADDFTQMGAIVLMDIVDKYNPDLGCSFKTFTYDRVKGGILEQRRKFARRKRLMEDPRVEKIYLRSVVNVTPADILDQKQIKELVKEKVLQLPEKMKTVLLLYYYENKTMREIGGVLSLTAGRISQIKSSGLRKLRESLQFLIEERRGIPV